MGTITRGFANNILTSGNYDASALSGTLPAISGANLTGVESNLVKISNTTISSDVSNVALEPSNFTDYKVYCIIINRLQFGSDNMNVRMTLKDSGGTYKADEYKSRTGDGSPSSTSYFLLSWDNVGNNTSGSEIYEDYSAQIFLSGFEVNRRLRYWGNCSYGDTGSNKRSFDIGGVKNYTTLVQGLKFAGSSGVIKSGQITLYGVVTG